MGSIVFANQHVGEVWYELKLIAEAAPPENLQPMRCSVGLRSEKVGGKSD